MRTMTRLLMSTSALIISLLAINSNIVIGRAVAVGVVVGSSPPSWAPAASSSSSSSSPGPGPGPNPNPNPASSSEKRKKKKVVTFVFGDSLTDVGNNNYLTYSLARCNFPWYGVDYEGGNPTGRFTNGRTIGDIISAKLGIESPPPYLSVSPNDDKLLIKGVNYASGGAGILDETGLYFIQRLSFDDQIDSFGNTTRVIRAKLGEQGALKLLNEALYFVGMGSNDYVNNFLQPFMADGQQYTHDQFLRILTSTLDQQLTRLYQYGARKIIFNGLGPIGCIPSQRAKSKQGKCLTRVNQWAQQFNSKVYNLLLKQNSRLPNASFVFADTYDDVFDLIANPHAYGFKVSNTSCCSVDTSIGGLCLPNSNLCSNRREYVFWDAFHPSDAANVILADKLFSTILKSSF